MDHIPDYVCIQSYPSIYYNGYRANNIDTTDYIDYDHPSHLTYDHHDAIFASLLTGH